MQSISRLFLGKALQILGGILMMPLFLFVIFLVVFAEYVPEVPANSVPSFVGSFLYVAVLLVVVGVVLIAAGLILAPDVSTEGRW